MPLLTPEQQEYIKRWGIAKAFYRAVMTRLKRFCGLTLCVIIVRPLRTAPPPPDNAHHRQYRLLTESELIEFSADKELALDPEEIKRNYARGDCCAGAIENAQLVGYLWRAYAPTWHDGNIYVDFGPTSRYAFKSFTRPAYRGQRILNDISVSTEALNLRGRTHAIAFIETHNFPSIKSARYNGNEFVGYAGYFSVFGKILFFRSTGAAKVGFRFFIPDTSRSAALADQPDKQPDKQR